MSQEIKPCWKVVLIDSGLNGDYSHNPPPFNGRMWSCWVSRASNLKEGTVRYKYGEWTSPNEGCGPLAVFDHYKNACKFIIRNKRSLHNFNITQASKWAIIPAEYIGYNDLDLDLWVCRGDLIAAVTEGGVLASAARLWHPDKEHVIAQDWYVADKKTEG